VSHHPFLKRVERMTQRKKTVARLILQGMCVLGILLGLSCVCFAVFLTIDIFSPIHQRDSLFFLCMEFLILLFMLALGIVLIRDSYLMLRGKAFGATKDFSVIVTLAYFVLAEPFLFIYENAPKGKRMTRFIGDIIIIAFFVSIWGVYKICVKLLKSLAEMAYGPQVLSGIQSSGAEHKENTNVEAT
jgi:hypothetical protein